MKGKCQPRTLYLKKLFFKNAHQINIIVYLLDWP